jgi:hypothetical protein
MVGMGLPWRALAVSWVFVLAACAGEERNRALLSADAVSVPSPSTATTPAPGTAIERPQEVRFRIDRQVGDDATAEFEAVVRATLTDPRGWQQAGFTFAFGDEAPFTIVLAEGEVVDGLCRPYDVGGRFSCQMGPVVALNAQRWRAATPTWTGDLTTYATRLRRLRPGSGCGRVYWEGSHHRRLLAVVERVRHQASGVVGEDGEA